MITWTPPHPTGQLKSKCADTIGYDFGVHCQGGNSKFYFITLYMCVWERDQNEHPQRFILSTVINSNLGWIWFIRLWYPVQISENSWNSTLMSVVPNQNQTITLY